MAITCSGLKVREYIREQHDLECTVHDIWEGESLGPLQHKPLRSLKSFRVQTSWLIILRLWIHDERIGTETVFWPDMCWSVVHGSVELLNSVWAVLLRGGSMTPNILVVVLWKGKRKLKLFYRHPCTGLRWQVAVSAIPSLSNLIEVSTSESILHLPCAGQRDHHPKILLGDGTPCTGLILTEFWETGRRHTRSQFPQGDTRCRGGIYPAWV